MWSGLSVYLRRVHGTVPTGSIPTGIVPTVTVPTGSIPTGIVPTGTVPTSASQKKQDTNLLPITSPNIY